VQAIQAQLVRVGVCGISALLPTHEEDLMTVRNRTPLFALVAIVGSALALPAMAQDAQDQAAAAQAQAAEAQDSAAQAQSAAASASSSAAKASAAAGGGQSWADVDADGDGVISKTESQANAGLAQVFDDADGNKDGKLTADEYRTYAAAHKK
jgi:hypothetical protein